MNQEQMIKAAIEDSTGYYVRWVTPMYGLNNKTDQYTGNIECRASVEDCINEVNLKVKERKLSYSLSELQKLESFIIIYNATIEGGIN